MRPGVVDSAVGAKRTAALAAALAAGILLLDQIAKVAIVRNLAVNESIEVVPHVLSLRHTENPAFAFGSFAMAAPESLVLPLVLLPIALFASLLVALRDRETRRSLLVPVALILGGALGNWVDRVSRGVVTDFLFFHGGSRRALVYNFADLAILAGMALIALWGIGRLVARFATARTGRTESA
jgi:signal peptidase II